jgi:pre-peptidase
MRPETGSLIEDATVPGKRGHEPLVSRGNGTGDADLYVRVGAPPTLTEYSCQPAKASADETCLVNLRVSDVIYVMVRGYTTLSSFKLTGAAK